MSNSLIWYCVFRSSDFIDNDFEEDDDDKDENDNDKDTNIPSNMESISSCRPSILLDGTSEKWKEKCEDVTIPNIVNKTSNESFKHEIQLMCIIREKNKHGHSRYHYT